MKYSHILPNIFLQLFKSTYIVMLIKQWIFVFQYHCDIGYSPIFDHNEDYERVAHARSLFSKK